MITAKPTRGLSDFPKRCAHRLRLLSATIARHPPVFSVGAEVASDLVALSFDDGPSNHTPLLLEILAAHEARATFFVVGRNAETHPELVASIGRLHEVGNHTHTHPHPAGLTNDQLRSEIIAADRAIRAAGSVARLARPPWGEHLNRFNRVARELGMQTVMWSVDGDDTTTASTRAVAARVAKVRGGDIMLFHEGSASSQVGLDVLEMTLFALRSRGFGVVTVSDLLDRRQAGRPERAEPVAWASVRE